jgi:nitroreductase
MMTELVTKTRSYRRFKQDPITREILLELVNLGRLSASGGNAQPLKYLLSCDTATNATIFPTLAWAGNLKDWPGPAEGERPTAYIVLLTDTEIGKSPGVDHGIAAQSILLGAMEKGIGGCMIGSVRREQLRAGLGLPERYEIALILALGVPGETVIIDDMAPGGSTKYYRDAGDRHHVPKRGLSEVIVRS